MDGVRAQKRQTQMTNTSVQLKWLDFKFETQNDTRFIPTEKKMKKKNEREKMRRQRHEMIIFIVENCQVPALLLPWRRWRWNEGSVATQRQPLTNAFVTSVLCNPANSFATIFFSSLSSILSFGYVQDFRENDSISEKCFGEWVLCA